jgi:ribosome-binding factor A
VVLRKSDENKKKSFLLQELSVLLRQISADEPKLSTLFVTRVELSPEGGLCYVYFTTLTDESAFSEGLEVLKLYKPSVRKALAQIMKTRYVPDLAFRYDHTKEKERRINSLLDKIHDEHH